MGVDESIGILDSYNRFTHFQEIADAGDRHVEN